MKNILLILTLITHLSFAATPEQVEQYLTVSNAEEELLALQSQFSAMQNGFSQDENSSKNTYDMQMLSIRFKDYIQKHLSDDEMEVILQNYKNVVLLQFISASNDKEERDINASTAYQKKLLSDPESATRIEIIKQIGEKLYSTEAMSIMFDGLMKPLLANAKGNEGMNDDMLKSIRENYLRTMLESAQTEILYVARDFTMEELEELLKVVKTPATNHESKAVFGAMAYSLKEFFLSFASRYDVTKHQPRSTEDTEHTK